MLRKRGAAHAAEAPRAAELGAPDAPLCPGACASERARERGGREGESERARACRRGSCPTGSLVNVWQAKSTLSSAARNSWAAMYGVPAPASLDFARSRAPVVPVVPLTDGHAVQLHSHRWSAHSWSLGRASRSSIEVRPATHALAVPVHACCSMWALSKAGVLCTPEPCPPSRTHLHVRVYVAGKTENPFANHPNVTHLKCDRLNEVLDLECLVCVCVTRRSTVNPQF